MLKILRQPASIGSLGGELESAIQILRRQIATTRKEDPWAYCDLGLLHALSGSQNEAWSAWDEMDSREPVQSVYTFGLPVLEELAAALPAQRLLANAVERFGRRIETS